MKTVINSRNAQHRHIAEKDFAPCAEAFIDRRNPNSEGKLNYSFIGPGVAQSDKQIVNLGEPHGFNVGGVSLPHGRINNLHLHFTAEVFIVAAGEWEFLWGNRGENFAPLAPLDLFAIPTWIFRGFINRGGDDGFMFAVLGGDDTGGIIWNPHVLTDAQKAGLRLTSTNRVIDEQKGESLPKGESFMPPMPEEEMHRLPQFSPAQMESYIVRWNNLNWKKDALPAGGTLATALGNGMTAARHHPPPVGGAHGFSLEWLRLAAGEDTGAWRVATKQVFIVFGGEPEIIINQGADETAVPLSVRSLYSVPAGAWRRITNRGKKECIVLAASAGDARLHPEWSKETLAKTAANGMHMDADGRLAPVSALPPHSDN